MTDKFGFRPPINENELFVAEFFEKLISGLKEAVEKKQEETGASLRDLSASISRDPAQVSRILSATHNVSVRTLAEVCRALELTIDGCVRYVHVGQDDDDMTVHGINYYNELSSVSPEPMPDMNMLRLKNYTPFGFSGDGSAKPLSKQGIAK